MNPIKKQRRYILILGAMLITLVPTVLGAYGNSTACYAYNQNGDIVTSCNGTVERVTSFGNLTEFAISPNGTELAFVREWHHHLIDTLQIVKLSPPFSQRDFPDYGDLDISCGTILYLYNHPKDLLKGKDPVSDSLEHIRCSSDRSVLVGWQDLGHFMGRIVLERPHSAPVTFATGKVGHSQFNVSPNGWFVGYSKQEKYADQICIMDLKDSATGNSKCYAADPIDKFSVTDDGDVLFHAFSPIGEGCYFKDSYHQSPKQLPGYSGMDECSVIAHVRPGMKEPEVLRKYVTEPQWISVQSAKALHEWRLSRTKK